MQEFMPSASPGPAHSPSRAWQGARPRGKATSLLEGRAFRLRRQQNACYHPADHALRAPSQPPWGGACPSVALRLAWRLGIHGEEPLTHPQPRTAALGSPGPARPPAPVPWLTGVPSHAQLQPPPACSTSPGPKWTEGRRVCESASGLGHSPALAAPLLRSEGRRWPLGIKGDGAQR